MMLELKIVGWTALAGGWVSAIAALQATGVAIDPRTLWWPTPLLITIVATTIAVTWRVFKLLDRVEHESRRLHRRVRRLQRELKTHGIDFVFDDEDETGLDD